MLEGHVHWGFGLLSFLSLPRMHPLEVAVDSTAVSWRAISFVMESSNKALKAIFANREYL